MRAPADGDTGLGFALGCPPAPGLQARCALVCLGVWLVLGTAMAQAAPAGAAIEAPSPANARPPQVDLTRLDYRLNPRLVAPGSWVFEGALEDFSRTNGCNIINTAVIGGPQGSWVINTGPSRLYGEQQRRAVQALGLGPVQRVINLNLHPDYFFGNQAWADRPTQALTGSIAGMLAEGPAYADNLYRLCGDWMKDTASTPAAEPLAAGPLVLAERRLELHRLSGHTNDDLVLLDREQGVLYAGGLVFAQRVPTTPHADFEAWLASLDVLQRWHAQGLFHTVVPSHGPVHTGLLGIEQTRDWLRWLHQTMTDSAQGGLDLAEVLRLPVPARFADWIAQPAELQRSLAQMYPSYEQAALLPLAAQ